MFFQKIGPYPLKQINERRGDLLTIDFSEDLPFKPVRFFLIQEVPTGSTRGGHAHLKCEQFLIALKGEIRIRISNGEHEEFFDLGNRTEGVYLPPLHWGEQIFVTEGSILGVFASHVYDSSDYVRTFEDFLEIISRDEKI